MRLGRRPQLSNLEGYSAKGLLQEAYSRFDQKKRGENAKVLLPLDLSGLAKTISVLQFISNLWS
jgi:hypothetical protein